MTDHPHDPLDIASDLAERERVLHLQRQLAQSRTLEDTPCEDAQGHRYCLDCEELIPPQRVQAVQAVRCVDCTQRLESRIGSRRLSGGIRHYPAGNPAFSGGSEDD